MWPQKPDKAGNIRLGTTHKHIQDLLALRHGYSPCYIILRVIVLIAHFLTNNCLGPQMNRILSTPFPQHIPSRNQVKHFLPDNIIILSSRVQYINWWPQSINSLPCLFKTVGDITKYKYIIWKVTNVFYMDIKTDTNRMHRFGFMHLTKTRALHRELGQSNTKLFWTTSINMNVQSQPVLV